MVSDAAADAGGVDEDPGPPTGSISSSTGSRVVPARVVDDDPGGAGQLVQQRDLPTFGRPMSATRATALDGTMITGDCGGRREHLEQPVEEVAGAAAVKGGDGIRLAEAEIPQGEGIGLPCARRRPCWPRGSPACPGPAQQLTTASSSSVAPTLASTTKTTTSAGGRPRLQPVRRPAGGCRWRRSTSRRCRRR